MSDNKKLFWLKLKKDFFDSRSMKKLRSIAGGDTYTIIYLKMLLKGLENQGNLYFEGVDETLAEELALELNEQVDNVKVTISFLQRVGLAEVVNDDIYLTETKELTIAESSSAERVRKHREKQKALQCNTDVTKLKQKCNLDIDIDKDIDIDIDIDKDIDTDKDIEKHMSKTPTNSKDELKETKAKVTSEHIDYIVSEFNRICIDMKPVQIITPNRKQKTGAIIRKYGLEKIIDCFKLANESDFLSGRGTDWIANFDWLIKESNFIKVIEGNYSKNENAKAKSKAEIAAERRRILANQMDGVIEDDREDDITNNRYVAGCISS